MSEELWRKAFYEVLAERAARAEADEEAAQREIRALRDDARQVEAERDALAEALRTLIPWAEMAADSDNMATWGYDDLQRDLAAARKALDKLGKD